MAVNISVILGLFKGYRYSGNQGGLGSSPSDCVHGDKMSFQEKEDKVETWECEKLHHHIECIPCGTTMEETESLGWRLHMVIVKRHTFTCPDCDYQIQIER